MTSVLLSLIVYKSTALVLKFLYLSDTACARIHIATKNIMHSQRIHGAFMAQQCLLLTNPM
jgi:hypothetical protein